MKDTLRHNTMAEKLSRSVPMRKHHKSRNPLLARNRLRGGKDMLPILSFQRLQVSKDTTAPKDLLELTQSIALYME